MEAKIITNPHYTHNVDSEEVFTLVVTKDAISSFGRTYTIPELQDIAETIISFLEKRDHERTTLQVQPDDIA